MEDMDIYYRMIVFVYAIVGMYGTGYILFRFAKPFMENKRGAFSILIAYFATMLILYFVPMEINTFTAYGFGILSSFIIMCRIDRRNYKQKIFIGITFYSLDWLTEYMTRIITEAIYNQENVYDNFYIASEHPVTKLMIFSGVELLDMVMGFVLLGISVGYIVKTYVYKREDMSIKELFMLTVPSIGYGIMIYYQTIWERIGWRLFPAYTMVWHFCTLVYPLLR